MGGHLAIQGDLAQLDLAVFPACGSRDLSGSTGPVPGIHSCFSAGDALATAPLDHGAASKHVGRSRGAMKRFSMICTVTEVSRLPRGFSREKVSSPPLRKTKTRRFCICYARLDM